jgi:hypothetical protein
MISITNFTAEDYKIVEENKNGYRIYLFIFLIFLTPLSFLVGGFGLAKKGFGYWPTTIGFLLFFFFLIIYLIIKDYVLYKKDLKSQLKYSGTITVLNKSKNKRDCYIYTDSKDVKKMDVLFLKVFNQIEIGDELYIDVTKYGKSILKLKKGELVLLDGS